MPFRRWRKVFPEEFLCCQDMKVNKHYKPDKKQKYIIICGIHPRNSPWDCGHRCCLPLKQTYHKHKSMKKSKGMMKERSNPFS